MVFKVQRILLIVEILCFIDVPISTEHNSFFFIVFEFWLYFCFQIKDIGLLFVEKQFLS